ncbi:hypothetical protein ABPG72_020194 [Tetrahymena utriculariae]
MQGHQRKFGQSPSQDNLQMLAGYNNGQNFPQSQGNSNQRLQTPPPPNTQSKMATTIQGTGVKMINNQFGVSMKLPQANNGSSNGASIKSVELNKKIKNENENLQEKIKELEIKGKQSNFDYTKNHIDVANYIMNNYSKYRELITELAELKNQHLDETKKNRQLREQNEQMKSKQRGYVSLNPQEQQEQNRQAELNRQIEQVQKENQQLQHDLKSLENEINNNTSTIQQKADKTFSSQQEKQQLTDQCNQIQQKISKLTEQLEEEEKRQKENSANSQKKNFFQEYDQMCRQVAQLRQQNQDLTESLKQKIIEICKLQGKEPPNFNQGVFPNQFQN